MVAPCTSMKDVLPQSDRQDGAQSARGQANFYFNVPRGFEQPVAITSSGTRPSLAISSSSSKVCSTPAQRCHRAFGSAWRVRPSRSSVRCGSPRREGATEEFSALSSVYWPIERASCIGGPLPGVEISSSRTPESFELRVRGPNVFPGYRSAPEISAGRYDDGGYCRSEMPASWWTGPPERASRSMARVAGTFQADEWHLGVGGHPARPRRHPMTPYTTDVVVTGHDREEVGLLVFPSPAARRISR